MKPISAEIRIAEIPSNPPEAVKKYGSVFFRSFRRKPESSVFGALRTAWTPVFTGVTNKRQFFSKLPFAEEDRGDLWEIFSEGESYPFQRAKGLRNFLLFFLCVLYG
jgi:hypothetical protein